MRAWLVLGLFALGCEESVRLGDLDASAPRDVGFRDATVRDVGFFDAASEDAQVVDVGFTDADPDAGFEDATADAGVLDASDPDAGSCNYLSVDDSLVSCAGNYVYASYLQDQNGRCPNVWRLLGNDYPDVASAIAGEGCLNCEWRPFQSVSFIDHCGRRNGYIIFRSADPMCPDRYEFSNGYYDSVEQWERDTPC